MRLLFTILIAGEVLLAVAVMIPVVVTYLDYGHTDWQNLWFVAFLGLFIGFHLALYPVEAAGGDKAEVHALQKRWGKTLWILFLAVLFLELFAAVGAGVAILTSDEFFDRMEAVQVFAFANGFAGVQLALLLRPGPARTD